MPKGPRRPKADQRANGGQQDPVPMGPTGSKRGILGGKAQKEVQRFRFEPADLVYYYDLCAGVNSLRGSSITTILLAVTISAKATRSESGQGSRSDESGND